MKTTLTLILLCASCAEPLYSACGLNVYDDRVTPEIACAAVAGVEAAYLANGDDVPVEDVIDGLSVERGSPPGTKGYFQWGSGVRDEIQVSVSVGGAILVDTLTHEIIHAVQVRWEGMDSDEIAPHTCPWYGYESDLKCADLAEGKSLWKYATFDAVLYLCEKGLCAWR